MNKFFVRSEKATPEGWVAVFENSFQNRRDAVDWARGHAVAWLLTNPKPGADLRFVVRYGSLTPGLKPFQEEYAAFFAE